MLQLKLIYSIVLQILWLESHVVSSYAQWLLLGVFVQKLFDTNLNFRYVPLSRKSEKINALNRELLKAMVVRLSNISSKTA